MFCKNCGAKIPENAKFCPKCGASLISADPTNDVPISPADQGNTDAPDEGGWFKKHRKAVLAILIIVIAAVVAIVVVLLVRHSANQKASAIEEHREMGAAYIDEGEYEEAAAEYAAIIEIEPDMQTYRYLAESYLVLSGEEEPAGDVQTEYAGNTYEGPADEVYVEIIGDVYEDAVAFAVDSYERTGELPEFTQDLFDEALGYATHYDEVEGLSELGKVVASSATGDEEAESYFISHDLEIDPTGDLRVYTIQTLNDGEDYSLGWAKFGANIETVPSDEPGYVDTTLTLVETNAEFTGSEISLYTCLYDYSTGRDYESMDTCRETDDDSDYDYAVTLVGENGDLFDVCFSEVRQINEGRGSIMTVHHPEEYDGTVFAIVGCDIDVKPGYNNRFFSKETVKIDEHGYDLETGKRMAITDMADPLYWTWYGDGSGLSEEDLSKFDIHFLKDGVEGEFTPYFVENDIDVITLPDDSSEVAMEINIVEDDGTPGTATLHICRESGPVSQLSHSELADDYADDFSMSGIRLYFSNVKFEDGRDDYTFSWNYDIWDYYSGDYIDAGELDEIKDNGEVWRVNQISNTFIYWDGQSFDYWIENNPGIDDDVHYHYLAHPDWYDGTVIYLNFDDNPDNALYFVIDQ